MESISVMLIDDNPVFLRVAAQFLEAHDGITVVGTIDGSQRSLQQAEVWQPQIILVDLAMPDIPGLKLIPLLRRAMPDVGIIALTVMNTNSFRKAALTAGANHFVPKAAMRAELLPAIRQLVNGTEPVAEPVAHTDTTTPPSILVVEDEAHLRRLFTKALDKVGYKVMSAATVQEARDLLLREQFDILLCDVHLGGERGTDLLRDSASTLFTSGAQIIVVSGHAEYRAACEEVGADFFLEKPVSVETLIMLVDRLTARHSLRPASG